MSLLGKTPDENPRDWSKWGVFLGISIMVIIIAKISPILALPIAIGGVVYWNWDRFANRKDRKEADEYEKRMKEEGKWH